MKIKDIKNGARVRCLFKASYKEYFGSVGTIFRVNKEHPHFNIVFYVHFDDISLVYRGPWTSPELFELIKPIDNNIICKNKL